MEISYKEIAKKSFGGGNQIKPDAMTLRYAVSKNGKAQLKIKMGGDVMKKLKLQPKDRIDFVVDSEIGKAFVRPDSEGWQVYGSGKNGAGVVNLPWMADKLFEFNSKSAETIDWKWKAKKGIEFDVPEQSADETA